MAKLGSNKRPAVVRVRTMPKGEEIVAGPEEEAPKVVNLMEALRQSLDRVSSDKKKAARIGTA